ncbi:MAG: primosomal protein N' [Rhodovibrionaceae bacterium]
MADSHASAAPKASSAQRSEPRTSEEFSAGARVGVLLPLPLAGVYDYLVPEETSLSPGDIVEAPLGKRVLTAVVWGAGAGDVAESKLKTLLGRFAVPPLPEAERRFIDWVADYTLAPPGAVLRMALSAPQALQPPAPRRALVAAAAPEDMKITPARQRVLAAAADGFARPAAELAREAGVSAGVLKALVKAGALREVELAPARHFPLPDPATLGPKLSKAQGAAAAALRATLAECGFSVTLLDGVTGSGKTEVYFEAVAAALEAGRQVLVLLPEIALSAAWLKRFETRFGVRPAVWHSEVGHAERKRAWRAVAEGEARVVVGARSALFLPYAELGLIVVDEEHEAAFKQEDGVIYQARDMAVVRAKLGAFPIVLVSATPSLETLVNVEAGRYGHLELPERHGGALQPAVELVDLRRVQPEKIALASGEKLQSWLSPPLRQAISETLAAGEQGLLFLNRRGYAPLTLCRACGHRLQCPSCTAWLVEHRLTGRLQCHHCGFAAPLPKVCPGCEAADSFAACGPGVERLEEELRALYPEARIGVMSSDSITGPAMAERFLAAVQNHELDLVIGTQIIAKGHHFPMLTLVGVVDGDLGLAGGDLRASERTYQLLHQVAGRAGRAERPGKVLLQTTDPANPVMQALAAGDRDAFFRREIEARKEHRNPPFARLAAVIVSGPDADALDAFCGRITKAVPRDGGFEVHGPAPAPLAVLRGRHRRRFLLRCRRELHIQTLLRRWLAGLRPPGAIRLQIDVDPYSFM